MTAVGLGVCVGHTDNELMSIPAELAELESLEHLDLSRNRIYGHLPATLERCTVLAGDQKP